MARPDDLDGVTFWNVSARPLHVDDGWTVSLLMTDGTNEWEMSQTDMPLFETREQAEEHIARYPDFYNPSDTPAEESE